MWEAWETSYIESCAGHLVGVLSHMQCTADLLGACTAPSTPVCSHTSPYLSPHFQATRRALEAEEKTEAVRRAAMEAAEQFRALLKQHQQVGFDLNHMGGLGLVSEW